ncbi:MAG: thioredoxin domain-containing protein [Candidatus Nanopelagicales bacterium]
MKNRLANATSPYLQQHANNPVWWYEWSEEAFLAAKTQDLPIFLSIGYSACHWCHVMAHESFENEAVAEYLNKNFISIKVDREEHPEIDNIYMQATVSMTGHGGWPMSVFLDHQLRPFYAGTYFPLSAPAGHVTFPQLLNAIVDTWNNRRDDLSEAAERLSNHLIENNLPALSAETFTEQTAANAALKLMRQFDPINHGFGSSPKFPPSMALEFLLRHYARVDDPAFLELVEFTCYSMTRGGMYDQLAGGFARYSVDEKWTIPHFEKMLYDNALLLGVYSHLYRLKPTPYFKRIVEETVDWLFSEMLTSQGAFAAAIDADSEGEEGVFYCWSKAQFMDLLDETDAKWALDQFSVTEAGTFEAGLSVLQRRKEPSDLVRYQKVKEILIRERQKRIRPMRDEKVILSWNCWAIVNLIEAGEIFGEQEWTKRAIAALDYLLATHLVEDKLYRISKDGVTNAISGLLEDWASLITACLKAHAATGETIYFEKSKFLMKQILNRFRDQEIFYDVETTQEMPITKTRDSTDNAYPSALALAAEALINFGASTNDRELISIAEDLINEQLTKIETSPRFAAHYLCQLEALLDGPLEIALVGKPGSELHKIIWQSPRAGWVLSVGNAGATDLLQDRFEIDGKPTVYLCQNFSCLSPVTELGEVKKQLKIV